MSTPTSADSSPSTSVSSSSLWTKIQKTVMQDDASEDSDHERDEKGDSFAKVAEQAVRYTKFQTLIPVLNNSPETRTEQDLENLKMLTEFVPFFRGMVAEKHLSLCSVMKYEFHPAGTILFNQGDEGHCLYIIWRGNVHVMVNTKGGSKSPLEDPDKWQTVASLVTGDMFGELALLRADNKRSATALAVTDSEFVTLHKAECVGILKRVHHGEALRLLEMPSSDRTEEDLQKLLVYVKSYSFFRSLPRNATSALCKCMTHRHFKPKEAIFTKGETSNVFYVVMSGIVEVLGAPPGKVREVVVSTITAGHAVGERAVMAGENFDFTFRTGDQPLQTFCLQYEDFAHILQDSQQDQAKKKVSLLRGMFNQCKQFQPSMLLSMINYLEQQSFAATQVIAGQGSKIDGIYMISSGQCHVTISVDLYLRVASAEEWQEPIKVEGQPLVRTVDPRKKVTTKKTVTLDVAVLCPGEAIGEIYLWASCSRWPVTISAISDVEMYHIKKSHFDSSKLPGVIGSLRQSAVNKTMHHQQRINSLLDAHRKSGWIPKDLIVLPIPNVENVEVDIDPEKLANKIPKPPSAPSRRSSTVSSEGENQVCCKSVRNIGIHLGRNPENSPPLYYPAPPLTKRSHAHNDHNHSKPKTAIPSSRSSTVFPSSVYFNACNALSSMLKQASFSGDLHFKDTVVKSQPKRPTNPPPEFNSITDADRASFRWPLGIRPEISASSSFSKKMRQIPPWRPPRKLLDFSSRVSERAQLRGRIPPPWTIDDIESQEEKRKREEKLNAIYVREQ